MTTTISKSMQRLEAASVASTIAGSLVSIATQQIAYLSIPLSLTLGLHLVSYNRSKAAQRIRDTTLEQHHQALSGDLEQVKSTLGRLEKDQVELTQLYKQLQDILSYTQQIQNELQQAELYYKRGLVYRQLNQLEAALSDFNTAVSLDSSLAAAYFERATIKAARGQRQDAAADFKTAANAYFSQDDLIQYQEAKDRLQAMYDLRGDDQVSQNAVQATVAAFFS